MQITERDETIEKWAAEMQRPLLLLRATVSAVRAGIQMKPGETVEDALNNVWAVMENCPLPLVNLTLTTYSSGLAGVEE